MVYQNPKINSLVDNVISVPITIMHRSARSLNIPPAHPPPSLPSSSATHGHLTVVGTSGVGNLNLALLGWEN